MKNYIYFLLLFLIVDSCLFNSNNDQIIDDEKLIYSTIIDSVFDDSYKLIFIEDSSRSINRYIKKNLFSESLFGKEVDDYYESFFKKKNCEVDDELVKDFINNNRYNLFLTGNYAPQREHKYLSYKDIYYYINDKLRKRHKLYNILKNSPKFGMISFSRVGFNREKTEAFVEVDIYRIKRGELFFINLRKTDNAWKFSSNCYMYGPYRIRE